jgi:hypothetical protein
LRVGDAYHEVESCHEKNEVDQNHPMFLERNLSFSDESSSDITTFISNENTLLVGVGLRQAKTEDDDEDRRASTEPEEWPPSMARSVDQSSSESCRKQISKCISLLQYTRDQTTRRLGTILKSSRGSISIETAHGDTEERTAGKELFVGLAETGAELEDDEEKVVDNERPLSTVTVGSNTECDGADGSEHENESYSPCDVGCRFTELFGQIGDC